jgi:hypothetical protein
MRAAGAWIALSALGFALAEDAARGLLPLFRPICQLALQPDFVGSLSVQGTGPGAQLQLSALAVRDVPLRAPAFIPALERIPEVTTHAIHALVPAVLLGCVLLAWPAGSGLEVLRRTVFSCFALPAMLVSTTPILLVGKIYLAIAESGGASAAWLLAWVVFTETGGRWLIPLAVGALGVALARDRIRAGTERRADDQTLKRKCMTSPSRTT